MSGGATAEIEGGCYECGSTFGIVTEHGNGPICIKCNPEVASEQLQLFESVVSELSQDVINWRVAMGSWVGGAIEEYETALTDESTDKQARRWYQDARTAAKAIAKKYNIPNPAHQPEEGK